MRGLNVKNNAVNKEEFSEAMAECKREPYFTNEYLLCSGHDLMNMLSYGLRKKWGSNVQHVNREMLESLFRLAYSEQDFKKTNLYSSMKEWFQNQGIELL